jgi:hypothetical protein
MLLLSTTLLRLLSAVVRLPLSRGNEKMVRKSGSVLPISLSALVGHQAGTAGQDAGGGLYLGVVGFQGRRQRHRHTARAAGVLRVIGENIGLKDTLPFLVERVVGQLTVGRQEQEDANAKGYGQSKHVDCRVAFVFP